MRADERGGAAKNPFLQLAHPASTTEKSGPKRGKNKGNIASTLRKSGGGEKNKKKVIEVNDQVKKKELFGEGKKGAGQILDRYKSKR